MSTLQMLELLDRAWPYLGLACVAWTAYEVGRLLTRSSRIHAWDERGRSIPIEEVRFRRR